MLLNLSFFLVQKGLNVIPKLLQVQKRLNLLLIIYREGRVKFMNVY